MVILFKEILCVIKMLSKYVEGQASFVSAFLFCLIQFKSVEGLRSYVGNDAQSFTELAPRAGLWPILVEYR